MHADFSVVTWSFIPDYGVGGYDMYIQDIFAMGVKRRQFLTSYLESLPMLNDLKSFQNPTIRLLIISQTFNFGGGRRPVDSEYISFAN